MAKLHWIEIHIEYVGFMHNYSKLTQLRNNLQIVTLKKKNTDKYGVTIVLFF